MEIGAGALAHGFRVVARREPKARREDHQGLVLEAAVAIGKVQLPARDGVGLAGLVGVHHGDAFDDLGRAAPLGPSVHDGRSTDGAWNADGPLQARQTGTGRPPRQGGDGLACLGLNQAACALQLRSLDVAGAEGEPLEALIANQQVGAGSDDPLPAALGLGPAQEGQ